MRYVLLLLILYGQNLVGQGVLFQKNYDAPSPSVDLTVGDILELPDSGFFVLSSDATTSYGVVLARLNIWGDELWSKQYTASHALSATRIHPSGNNEYFLNLGQSLVKIDSSGNVIWSKRLDVGGFLSDTTKNGGLILGGLANNMVTLVKVDSMGNVVWSTMVDTLIKSLSYGLLTEPLINGSEQYIVIGQCMEDYGSFQALTTVSESGILQRNQLFSSVAVFLDLALAQDCTIYISGAGGYSDSVATYGGAALINVSPSGSVISAKVFHTTTTSINMNGASIHAFGTSIGLVGDIIGNPFEVYRLKTDTSLVLASQRRIHFNNQQLLTTRVHTLLRDGGQANISMIQPVANGPSHALLSRADMNGNSGCNESNLNLVTHDFVMTDTNDFYQYPLAASSFEDTIIVSEIFMNITTNCTSVAIDESIFASTIKIIPNPATSTILVNTPHHDMNNISLYDCFGRECLSIHKCAGEHEIDISFLPQGIYTVVINRSLPIKLVVLD
jgi:hypothetical protein